MPSAASTAGPQGQLPRAMAEAIARARREAGVVALGQFRQQRSRRLVQHGRLVLQRRRRASPSARARPRGVGRQNRAGRTKAKSSSRSSAGNRSMPSRAAIAGTWQVIGGSFRARTAASASFNGRISPDGSIQAAPAAPAARIGDRGISSGRAVPYSRECSENARLLLAQRLLT